MPDQTQVPTVTLPTITVINDESVFGIFIQTDQGRTFHHLTGNAYGYPVIWRFQGRVWMFLTEAYSGGPVPINRPIELVIH